jgi:hypothetical protein
MTLVGLSFFLYCVSIVSNSHLTLIVFAHSVLGGLCSKISLCPTCLFLDDRTGVCEDPHFDCECSSLQLGYYMSTLWISRALNLLVLLPSKYNLHLFRVIILIFPPVIIHYFKPKRTSPPGTQPSPSDIAAELVFDKYLAQISLFIDGLADALVAVVSNKSQPIFVLLSCLNSFTSGGNPALQSLGAVCLHVLDASDQTGALFGALGVLNSVAHIMSVSHLLLLTFRSYLLTSPR